MELIAEFSRAGTLKEHTEFYIVSVDSSKLQQLWADFNGESKYTRAANCSFVAKCSGWF